VTEIRLSPKEVLQGAVVGAMRQVENLKAGRQPAYGAGVLNDWQLHIEGALGEMAFAKFAGLYWSGAHGFRADDVGSWQIRTRSEDWHELILHEDDADDRRFVLITGRNGDYVIHGWIFAKEGKRADLWKDPAKGRPAFFVPQSELTRFES
jgi:hypothetical protein